ncbi:MAG: hypothetical protein A2Y84_01830 [Candidatus Colwellbacteria bacterium RBG_13_48_8]|uniref:Aminodeoxychorismate lyase n=1 Tax=Candidatus Colwellbacteria bacterium RBG_13_48_8 TaxID=1797685 RepID=A0A1G1YYA3_9BACT|nr:MAG: hypothetical protein A2Y84_01830 [Candidatus Colwellbacteria bacterium RBG_13_48_8]
MKRLAISIIAFVVLALGAFGLWRLIRISQIPEAPRAVITVPEGWTVRKINQLLQKEGILVDRELPPGLEGYLFPDTYEFFLDSSTEVVTSKFQSNFKSQVGKIGLDINDSKTADIIIMASMLEKEIKEPEERRVASGVLWRRLDVGVPLQVDATICFIKEEDECLPITNGDKKIDSPYNTYLYKDLPPSPISNPGLESILAALRPADSSYWYYLSDLETGETIFAETLDEHNQNIIKYLGE